MREEHGTTRLEKSRAGVVFFVDDGSGPVAVDASAGIEADLEKTFEIEPEMGWGDFQIAYELAVKRLLVTPPLAPELPRVLAFTPPVIEAPAPEASAPRAVVRARRKSARR